MGDRIRYAFKAERDFLLLRARKAGSCSDDGDEVTAATPALALAAAALRAIIAEQAARIAEMEAGS